jgi:hypothetical protein
MTNQSYSHNPLLSDENLPWDQPASSANESQNPYPGQTNHSISVYQTMINTPLPKYCSWVQHQGLPLLRIQNTEPLPACIGVLLFSMMGICATCIAIVFIDKPNWFFISLIFILFISFICASMYYIISCSTSTWIYFEGSCIKIARGHIQPRYWNNLNPFMTIVSSLELQTIQTNDLFDTSSPNHLNLCTLSLLELPMPYHVLREKLIQSHNMSSGKNEPYFPYELQNCRLDYRHMHPAKRMRLQEKERELSQNIENMKTQSQLVIRVKNRQDYENIANLLNYFIKLYIGAVPAQQ